jgi:hypothetical protein
MIQGAQLVIGRFSASTKAPDFDLSLLDACNGHAPIIFTPAASTGDSIASFSASTPLPPGSNTRGTSHRISCSPMPDVIGTAAKPLLP